MAATGKETDHQSEQGLHPHIKTDVVSKFDEYKIVEHYVRLREWQQERLATCNLSEELKRKLFGFSEGYYFTNAHDPYRLLLENHPLKGRTLMTEERHRYEMHNAFRGGDLNASRPVSEAKNFSEEKMYIDSDLDLPFRESAVSV